jgi:pimeloyl-ACP methyl ester carboxylesterase
VGVRLIAPDRPGVGRSTPWPRRRLLVSPTTPEPFAAFVNDGRGKWREVIKTAGVTVD